MVRLKTSANTDVVKRSLILKVSAALPSSEPVIWQAVRYAYAKNVVISTSAGNIPRAQWGLRPQDGMYRSFDHEVLLVGGVAHKGATLRPWEHTMPGPQIDRKSVV